MNRGRRRLGSTSVESCLSLGTPSMLPPPTPAGEEVDACAAQQQQASSSPLLSVTDERGSGAFFGGRRESCGGKSEAVVVSGEGGVEEAEAESPVERLEEVTQPPLSPATVVEPLLKEDVKVASEGALKKEDIEMEAVRGGGKGEEELLVSAADLRREMEVGGGDKADLGREEWKYSELKMEDDADKSEEAVILEGEVAVGREILAPAAETSTPVASEIVAPVACMAEEDAVASMAEEDEVASIANEEELDNIEDVGDADFAMPKASAAAAAVATAVAMAAAAALLPAVLEEPAAEAAAAVAAATASVAAKDEGGADVVLEKAEKGDYGGGKEGMVCVKTLACCGVVAFGVGLAVAALVRSSGRYGVW